MALIVEDGTGKPDADALISVDFADDYHEKFGNTGWAEITEPKKEINIRKATQFLNKTYRQIVLGVLAIEGQSQLFPRSYLKLDRSTAYYTSGYLPNDIVPIEWQEACAELALIAETTDLMPTNQTRGKKRVKIGPLEIEYDGYASSGNAFVNALSGLSIYLGGFSNGGVCVPLVRV